MECLQAAEKYAGVKLEEFPTKENEVLEKMSEVTKMIQMVRIVRSRDYSIETRRRRILLKIRGEEEAAQEGQEGTQREDIRAQGQESQFLILNLYNKRRKRFIRDSLPWLIY